jgi:hypothetical protein
METTMSDDLALPVRSLETLLSKPLPPTDWLVEPLIANGNRVLVYGEWGSYKSWLLLDLALHLAAGKPWLDTFPVPRARRVIYLDEEMSPRELQRRIKLLALGAEIAEASNLQTASQVGFRFSRFGGHAPLLARLRASEIDPEVIIVESFRRVFEGNENSAEDVTAFWHAVAPVAKAGKTVVLSHHMKKASPQYPTAARDRASGSTDIMAGLDTAYAVTRNVYRDVSVVECTKAREFDEPDAFAVSMSGESVDHPVVLRYEGLRAEFAAVASKADQTAPLIKAFLASQPDQTADWTAIVEHLVGKGISERTAERVRPAMRRAGELVTAGKGRWRYVMPVAQAA